MSSDVALRVKEIVSSQLEVPLANVREDASFIDDLRADSLAVVELVLALEQAYGLEIPEEDTERLKTVGDAINYIRTHANR